MNVCPRCEIAALSVALFLLAGAGQAWGQVYGGLDPYHHVYHRGLGYVPYGYGGYGGYGYGGAATAASGFGAAAAGEGVRAAGIGRAAAGIGEGRLSTAQAQQAHQSAATQYLQNIGLAQQTALETSARKDQAEEQRDEATDAKIKKQVALYNKTLHQMSAAHRLSAEQFDLDRGVLHWPFVLRGQEYADLRQKLDTLYHERTPEDSGNDSSGYDAIQQACKQMQEIVDGKVKEGEMPVNDYVTAKHFISSVAYEARFTVKASK